MMPKTRLPIPVWQRVMAVVSGQRSRTVAQIADDIDTDYPYVHRTIQDLVTHGYLRKTNKGYIIEHKHKRLGKHLAEVYHDEIYVLQR